MSKKNLSVNLKNSFKNFKDLSNIFQNFKRKLDRLNKKSYAVAVSGGPDSLALVALSKFYSYNFEFISFMHKSSRKKQDQFSCQTTHY